MGFKQLMEHQILRGNGGAALEGLSDTERAQLVEHTPLWFYVLCDAEVNEARPGADRTP
jgi:hypothetical protein